MAIASNAQQPLHAMAPQENHTLTLQSTETLAGCRPRKRIHENILFVLQYSTTSTLYSGVLNRLELRLLLYKSHIQLETK